MLVEGWGACLAHEHVYADHDDSVSSASSVLQRLAAGCCRACCAVTWCGVAWIACCRAVEQSRQAYPILYQDSCGCLSRSSLQLTSNKLHCATLPVGFESAGRQLQRFGRFLSVCSAEHSWLRLDWRGLRPTLLINSLSMYRVVQLAAQPQDEPCQSGAQWC